ncbi:SDR family NAD(P)-dependent oxidoreductase [Herbiconiux sp.]|uniref:SDR family NAD(P)-dependent oxidoreductase n=1 Tax=Herbiconiux sp. TaxID=1871186 RepID=UPI0025C63CC5|nr:SDR family NAD(P)-dependent oxidoreductase [Herbiconiux sp.]
MTLPSVTEQRAPSRRLEGTRMLVTGGARGIGAAIARRCTAEGAEVVVLDRLAEQGSAFAQEIGCHFVPVDLGDQANTEDAFGTALEKLGGIDVLVNNAGILRFAPLLEITVQEWETMFAINTTAMLITTQLAARSMIAAGTGGKVVNMASMAGKTGGAGQGHYAASKSAVIALTRVTALELGASGITANCICPGYVLTEMGADTRTADDVAEWSSYSPLGRLADPADVAGVAAFLASADSDYMTGQALNVTGGMLMS